MNKFFRAGMDQPAKSYEQASVYLKNKNKNSKYYAKP